jgi:hypothetical protein
VFIWLETTNGSDVVVVDDRTGNVDENGDEVGQEGIEGRVSRGKGSNVWNS